MLHHRSVLVWLDGLDQSYPLDGPDSQWSDHRVWNLCYFPAMLQLSHRLLLDLVSHLIMCVCRCLFLTTSSAPPRSLLPTRLSGLPWERRFRCSRDRCLRIWASSGLVRSWDVLLLSWPRSRWHSSNLALVCANIQVRAGFRVSFDGGVCEGGTGVCVERVRVC